MSYSEGNNKNFGFTLAEVLIVLAIIGIVSALTLPSVINHFKAKKLETMFKSTNSLILEALNRALYESSYEITDLYISKDKLSDENFQDFQNRVAVLNQKFLNQFKGIKPAPNLYNSVCLGERICYCHGLNGNKLPSQHGCYYEAGQPYLLPDGRLISTVEARRYGGPWNDAGIKIVFDTNGPFNGPNRIGYDIFSYETAKDKNGRLNHAKCDNTAYNHDTNFCYIYATSNQNPTGKTNSYWDILYKPESYWDK